MSNLSELFQLSAEEAALSKQLQQLIKTEIQAQGGIIPFSRYMELALYAPGLGYYSNPRLKFGAKGDFVTAPLVSGLFAFALCQQLFELFNFGVKRNVLEFGAGNGQLAADILAASGEAITKYYILELSADLIAYQRETIRTNAKEHLAKVEWLRQLPTNFEGIMLANEVLDAQPCHLVSLHGGSLHGGSLPGESMHGPGAVAESVGVSLGFDNAQTERFCYKNYRLEASCQPLVAELGLNYSNYQTEIHLASAGFIRSLANSLQHGAVLLLDYGYGEQEYYHPQKTTGTLRGFYRQHLVEDVLLYPGLMDITSSVNWTLVASTAIMGGLELIGYTNQAAFLLNCGLVAQLSQLREQLNESKYLQLVNQANRLLSANEMGEVFKVMGFSKGLTQDSWLGFSQGDRSYSL